MTEIETGGPAFPSGLIDPSTPEDAVQPLHSGMTLRQYAAIKLKVPNSGADWLNEMIRESLKDDFAAKVLQGICASGPSKTWTNEMLSKESYLIANAMLRARSV